MDNKQIREKGRLAFKANYWKCVLVAFIMSILTTGLLTATGGTTKGASTSGGSAISALSPEQLSTVVAAAVGTITLIGVIGILLKIFLFNPILVGGYRFFKKNLDSPQEVGVVAEGFSGYGHIFATLFLRDLFLWLWTCLFVIPGIIKLYSYRLVPYILKDNPELSATEVITKSKEMMKGNKWRAFCLDFSFIGWDILGLLTCGLVNLFWTSPYHKSAHAQFYVDLLDRS